MGIKKKTSLKKAFWKFLIWLLAGLGVSAAVPFYAMLLAANAGMLTFADSCERQTMALVPVLTAAPDIRDIKLPAGTKYLLLDRSYEQLDTSMTEEEAAQAMTFATTGQSVPGGKTQFVLVTRNEESLILQYYVGSQFIHPWLNEHLPSPEIFLIGIIILNCLMVCIFLTAHFAKRLGRELTPLFHATREIKEQNLDFEMGHSQIAEFENVLLSFDQMRSSLKESLEQQWRAEKAQREQIASLAHDLKTPLTVIQGNMDLLNETALDEEQALYASYVLDSSQQMKEYIRLLIDISKASAGYVLNKEAIPFPEFWAHILSQTEILCREKQLRLETHPENLPRTLQADPMLLERAVMNVISNALHYAPEHSALSVEACARQNCLEIRVTDCGCGFSEEGLKRARERFYMGDASRNTKLHYGMGLYIVNSIMEHHGGEVILKNSKETLGGEVTLRIPL